MLCGAHGPCPLSVWTEDLSHHPSKGCTEGAFVDSWDVDITQGVLCLAGICRFFPCTGKPMPRLALARWGGLRAIFLVLADLCGWGAVSGSTAWAWPLVLADLGSPIRAGCSELKVAARCSCCKAARSEQQVPTTPSHCTHRHFEEKTCFKKNEGKCRMWDLPLSYSLVSFLASEDSSEHSGGQTIIPVQLHNSSIAP